jgi:DNA replication protein DnaC
MATLDTAGTSGQIEALATELKLPTVRRLYHRLAREVTAQGGDYEAYLLAVLREEVAEREVHRVERRIKEARFPQVKLLSDLDFSVSAMPPQAQLMTLAEGDYIRQGRNIVALGNSGTGKTHLATGLGVAACHRGLRVRFYPVVTLASELEAAQEDHQLHRYLARFGRWDLVILDELGYLPLGKTGGELLFQAISERHEHGSLIVTSNLPFEHWTEVFHSERLTASLLDRLTDQATILAMNGPSFRLARTLAATGQPKAAAPRGTNSHAPTVTEATP